MCITWWSPLSCGLLLRAMRRGVIAIIAVLTVTAQSRGQSAAAPSPSILEALEGKVAAIKGSGRSFQNARPDIDWSDDDPQMQNEKLRVLNRILSVKLPQVATVDESRVRTHFQGVGDARLKRLLDQLGLPVLDAEQYLSVPLFVDTSSGEVRFVVSQKLGKVPTSKQLSVAMFLKSYAALPTALKASPSAWSHGLCSFVAADLTYPTFLSSTPDLETEAAIASLLFSKAPALFWEPYSELEDRFDKAAYYQRLIGALEAVGAEDPDKAFQELMRSPEEYNCQDQGEKKQLKDADDQQRPFVPHVHPAMQILWHILPPDELGLRTTADHVAQTVRNTALRQVLLNACYDKLCAVMSIRKTGMLCDSGILLRNAVKEQPDDFGIDNDAMLREFDRRSAQALEAFEQELSKRPLPASKPGEIAFDPAALKWTFRYLYNYSEPIRRQEEALRKGLREQNPGAAEWDIDKLLTKQVTEAAIEACWKADPRIQALFGTVGRPVLQLLPSTETDTGKELICTWRLNRHRTNDNEEVRIRIVDSFSSGGGQPKPGVYAKAKVIVRKSLEAEPEEIELGKVEKNDYVRTLSSLDVDRAEEDWARVVAVQRDQTRAPWEIASGGEQPLATGRKQPLYAQLKEADESTAWNWRLPLAVHSGGDALLGILPEHEAGPEGPARLVPAAVEESHPGSRRQSLIVLSLSHREITELKESGAQDWGYFVDARFVHAPVYPTPPGVDGRAVVEVPQGGHPLQSIQAASDGREGDSIHGFEYRNPRTFVDLVTENKSKNVDYFIELVYTLPGRSQPTSLRIAEGQRLIVWHSAKNELDWREAYRLHPGMQLVCAFKGATPQTATLHQIKGIGEPLGVYRLKLKACPLVRANGLLVPVEVEKTKVCSGVEENSLIQMSPGLEAIRSAVEDAQGNDVRIDLSGSRVELARNLGNKAGGGARATADKFLCYNTMLPPRSFWSTGLSKEKPVRQYQCKRFVEIVTSRATLLCGHFQDVYATEGDIWRELTPTQASRLQPGRHKVVWLRQPSSLVAWSNAEEAERHVAAVADAAMSRVAAGMDVTQADTAVGAVELVPVLSVQEMHLDATEPEKRFREFTAADTRIARLGLRPTMFANGIMVSMRFENTGEGEDPGGGRGPNQGSPESPEEPGRGKYQPSYAGVVRELSQEIATVHYSPDDIQVFQKNLEDLDAKFRDRRINIGAVRAAVLQRFLAHYFSEIPPTDVVYSAGNLQQQFRNYVDAREFLIQTGDLRVTPAVINGYVMLATLLYEANAADAGNALTRDFLCLSIRTVNKGPGKEFYAGSARVKYAFRYGLMAVRDLLLYVRDKSQQDGFEPVAAVAFPAYRFQEVLNDYFVKQGCSEDICSKDEVNLYNLCRQLDKWSGAQLKLFESIVAPRFQPANLFQGDDLRQRLGTRGE